MVPKKKKKDFTVGRWGACLYRRPQRTSGTFIKQKSKCVTCCFILIIYYHYCSHLFIVNICCFIPVCGDTHVHLPNHTEKVGHSRERILISLCLHSILMTLEHKPGQVFVFIMICNILRRSLKDILLFRW